MGGMAVAACLWGTAQGAVYDASTGYVRLLVSGNAGFSPLSETTDKNDGKTYFWSDHLALHSGTNYYANKFFRSWTRTDGQAAMELNLDCGRFVLDNARSTGSARIRPGSCSGTTGFSCSRVP